jgi:hypothetical protein
LDPLIPEKGKYTTVYKKQADRSWKAIIDINNEEAPAKSLCVVSAAASWRRHLAGGFPV